MKDIWLVGTGSMGIEYAKVLNALKIDYIAIGRGKENANKFEKVSQHFTFTGGIEKFILSNPVIPTYAIVAVNVETLSFTAIALINAGVKNILLEKPGVCEPQEIKELVQIAQEKGANVLLAYNRRFYASVLKAEEIIANDNGVSSFNFEFTEWSHIIRTLDKAKVELNTWFLGNSTHVIDTAFYLGGKPKELVAFYKGGLEWHPSSSIFSGAGISEKDALFSYQANWEAPGRWAIEILTKKHKLYLKPMETLQIQNIGSVVINPVEIENRLDVDFKPGLYLQTKAFLDADYSKFVTIQEQKEMIENFYNKMCGYSNYFFV